MKMLPPSPLAIAGGEQRGGGGQDLQPVRLDQATARPRSAARAPPSDAGDDAADQPVADLLEHELRGRVLGDRAGVGLGERDRDEEERDAEAVVEAALDVEPLPDPRRDALVGDDRLAERGVRAGEHDGEHERLGEADPGQDARAPASAPARIVSGRPMPSSRSGTANSRRSARSEIRAASAKRTSVSVISASSFTCSLSTWTSIRPSTGPASSPRW